MIAITKCESNFDRYLEWLDSADAGYIVLDKLSNNLNDIYKCDSLILTGGVDVHPDISGLTKEDNQPYDIHRDVFELKVMDIALADKIPMLCICRGMQLINIKMKGSLVQDIETKYQNICHRKNADNTDRIHSVSVNENSLLYKITGVTKGEINSSHHQCIDKPAGEFEITSYADEVIPESMEWKDKSGKPPLLCIQWHPERMKDMNSPFSRNILEWIVKQKKHST